MRYSLTIPEVLFEGLVGHLFQTERVERAAYLLCRLVSGPGELRLLAREVIPVSDEETESSSRTHMIIASRSFLRAMKRANATRQAFVFVHSHPAGVPEQSRRDDEQEMMLFRTAHARIDGAPVHGSVVLSSPERPVGRVWLPNGSHVPIEAIRVVGNRLRTFRRGHIAEPNLGVYDRQIRAFGQNLQVELNQMRIGIVGAGGTGSAVGEQLARLGVGELLIADGQCLDTSNTTRVYGSSLAAAGRPKAEIQRDHITRMGFGTRVKVFHKDVTCRSVAEEFKLCDVIFGCTDDEWGRSLLTRLAIYYHVPVFDMGVKIDSNNGSIRSIQGRVTTLVAGAPCLFCRQRITIQGVRNESISALDPERAEEWRKEGYAPELAGPAPAVITFTSAVASSAVAELLHRLTGFMGSQRASSEVLHLFDQTTTRTTAGRVDADCFCQDRTKWGRGDVEPLLDTTWRPE